MKLSQLMTALAAAPRVLQQNSDPEIRGLAYDSRKIQQDFLFVAIPGTKVDGHDYIPQAVSAGAAAVICEHPVDVPAHVALVQVEDCRLALAALSACFYGYPDRKMRLIGVTGTNGKTTVTNLIKWLLEQGGHKVGLVGTICNMAGDKKLPSDHTTPESLELFELFDTMLAEGCDYACMEVSSHALAQGRVSACNFVGGVFTNLTQDHLDYHITMSNYLQSKARLFQMLDPAAGDNRYGVVNVNDKAHTTFEENCKAPVLTYGSEEEGITLCLLDYAPTVSGTVFTMSYQGALYQVKMPLIGKFNVYNALAAMAVALQEGMTIEQVLDAMAKVPQVPGRFELIDEGQDFTVVVDYAHTPDGLENLLSAAKKLEPRRLIALFGCGGNRDKGKRPIMGRIAASYGDVVVVTSDNPRFEDPMEIISEVEEGIREITPNYLVEENREKAIKMALNMAEPGDMVVLAGKGHEDYQVIGDKYVHCDDREIVREYLKEKLNK